MRRKRISILLVSGKHTQRVDERCCAASRVG